jgi:hypothetical protein
MLAPKPYLWLLDISTASSMFETLITEATGPNILHQRQAYRILRLLELWVRKNNLFYQVFFLPVIITAPSSTDFLTCKSISSNAF